MKGNRPKLNNETLPDKEVINHERRIEVRYGFAEISETLEDGSTLTSFNYKYFKVYDLKNIQLGEALSNKQIKKITDKAAIENSIAFKGRRWEELVCELEEDQTKKDELMSGNFYEGKVLDMPPEGEPVKKGNIYKFDAKHWGCRQPHERMHYHPSKTPALFNFIPIETEGIWVWETGVEVYDGSEEGRETTHCSFDDIEWYCIQGHTTQSDWDPESTEGTLWERV